jgi:tetratricopeptide (TPR) repeat protein
MHYLIGISSNNRSNSLFLVVFTLGLILSNTLVYGLSVYVDFNYTLSPPVISDKPDLVFPPLETADDKTKRSKLLNDAREFTANGQPEKARKNYLLLLKADSSDFDYNFELGMNYHLETADCRCCAIEYFERASRHLSLLRKVNELYYFQAEAYQFCERYEEAITSFTKFSRSLNENKKGGEALKLEITKQIEKCKRGEAFSATAKKNVLIEQLDSKINSKNAELTPVVPENDSLILFTVSSKFNVGGQKDPRENKYYEDMHISRKVKNHFVASEKFSDKYKSISAIKNTSTHDRVVWMSYDENLLITSKDRILYYSTIEKQQWAEPVMFPASVNRATQQYCASISPDGSTIYFSSNLKSGFGGLDIYKSVKQPNGSWGPAKNLGSTINTPEDEDSPIIFADGKTLYFSSKNNSIGGYDIFVSTLTDSSMWTTPVNMGVPINSPGDDSYFKPNAAFTEAYFASFRKGGLGDMDIYRAIIIQSDSKPFNNTPWLVAFDASGSIDQEGAKVLYNWDFGDGSEGWGVKIEHTFLHPGIYRVKLNVLDSITGRMEYDEKELEVNIENVTHIDFIAPDTIPCDSTFSLDARCSMLKNDSITGYAWNFGDNSNSRGNVVKHTYKKTGEYLIKLTLASRDVKAIDTDGLPLVLPYTEKKIVVISKSDYITYSTKKKNLQQHE